MKLSDKIRYLREVEGNLRGLNRAMTQQELLRALQAEGNGKAISQSYLSQIESGARPHLTNTTRLLLAKFFQVHPGYLVDDPDGYHAELISDLPTTEDKLDLWLVAGAERFRREISRARTFGCVNDVARLWSAGFALGASFENSVVFDETRLLNTEGLRYSDECVRHKVLDVIGDLALAGLPLLGAFRSVRGGHKLNHAVLTALLADRTAYRVVEGETARRTRTHAEVGSGMVGGMVAPAYGPDVS